MDTEIRGNQPMKVQKMLADGIELLLKLVYYLLIKSSSFVLCKTWFKH